MFVSWTRECFFAGESGVRCCSVPAAGAAGAAVVGV